MEILTRKYYADKVDSWIGKGNIIVLGSLKGAACAGVAGNKNAVVVAFEMAPNQVKISDITFHKAEKGKLLGRGPMMIVVENGRICSEPIKKNFFMSDVASSAQTPLTTSVLGCMTPGA